MNNWQWTAASVESVALYWFFGIVALGGLVKWLGGFIADKRFERTVRAYRQAWHRPKRKDEM